MSKPVQLEFWDLTGDMSYVEVRNEFYKDSQVCMIVVDTTS